MLYKPAGPWASPVFFVCQLKSNRQERQGRNGKNGIADERELTQMEKDQCLIQNHLRLSAFICGFNNLHSLGALGVLGG
jgi:hypothetical protein